MGKLDGKWQNFDKTSGGESSNNIAHGAGSEHYGFFSESENKKVISALVSLGLFSDDIKEVVIEPVTHLKESTAKIPNNDNQEAHEVLKKCLSSVFSCLENKMQAEDQKVDEEVVAEERSFTSRQS